MSSLLKYQTNNAKEYCFINEAKPKNILYKHNQPNELTLSNGQKINSPCLNCAKKPCMSFDESKKSDVANVVFFSDVCPTNAIFLDENKQVSIDEKSCIGCGLCALRCKTGAIYLFADKAKICKDKQYLVEGNISTYSISYSNNLVENFSKKTSEITKCIREHPKPSNVLNRLISGFFMSLGFKIVRPRQGDVNLRMDLIVESKEKLFLVEVNDKGDPDTIRDIVDDVAIFNSKYEYSLPSLAGIACLLEFPNTRSEFYELISDVEKVLNLKIYTLSLGILLSILYSHRELDIENFTINKDRTSSRLALEKILDKSCDFEVKSSAIEAAK